MNLKSVASTLETICFGKVNLLLLITNLCNSRCTICNHWSKPEKSNLSVGVIEKLLESKLVNKSGILLEGGEPLLHPNIKEILYLFKGLEYKLLTNGLLPDYLEKLVEDFEIPSVGVSLDGTRETYRRIRGVDGYPQVIETINRMRVLTDVSVCFTVCPSNTFDDYLHVRDICIENGVELLLNIYCESAYSGKLLDNLIDPRYEQLTNKYISKYNSWVKGKIKRNCFGMRYNCNVVPNGDVVLCQAKPKVVLGNLYTQSLDEIWKNKKLPYCNDCWMSCNRYLEAKI